MFLRKLSGQKFRGLLPLDRVILESPLVPILVVPLSRVTRLSVYIPLIIFPFCLPAIFTTATSVPVKIVFGLSFIFVFALCLSYSLHPSVTFNRDQLILHHKNHLHLSAIMYEDMLSAGLEHSFLVIETKEKRYYSLPLTRKYWPRMKGIFADHGVLISSQSPSD